MKGIKVLSVGGALVVFLCLIALAILFKINYDRTPRIDLDQKVTIYKVTPKVTYRVESIVWVVNYMGVRHHYDTSIKGIGVPLIKIDSAKAAQKAALTFHCEMLKKIITNEPDNL